MANMLTLCVTVNTLDTFMNGKYVNFRCKCKYIGHVINSVLIISIWTNWNIQKYGISMTTVAYVPIHPYGAQLHNSMTTVAYVPIHPYGAPLHNSMTTVEYVPIHQYGAHLHMASPWPQLNMFSYIPGAPSEYDTYIPGTPAIYGSTYNTGDCMLQWLRQRIYPCR